MSEEKPEASASLNANIKEIIEKSSFGELFFQYALAEKAKNIEREILAKRREIIKLQENLKEVDALISKDEGAPSKMDAFRPILLLLEKRAIEMAASGEASSLKVAWNIILDGFNMPKNKKPTYKTIQNELSKLRTQTS